MKISIDLLEATPEQLARFDSPHLQATLAGIRAVVGDERAPIGIRWIPGKGSVEVLHVVQFPAVMSVQLSDVESPRAM